MLLCPICENSLEIIKSKSQSRAQITVIKHGSKNKQNKTKILNIPETCAGNIQEEKEHMNFSYNIDIIVQVSVNKILH